MLRKLSASRPCSRSVRAWSKQVRCAAPVPAGAAAFLSCAVRARCRVVCADLIEVRPSLCSPSLAVAPPARGEHERSAVRLGLRAVLPPRGRTDGAAALTRAQRDRSRDESADHDERLRCAIERCRRAPPAECHEQVTHASPGCARGLRLCFTRARVLRALRATRQARVRPAVVPGHHALSELPCYRALIDRHRSLSIAIDRHRHLHERKPLFAHVNERRGNHCKTAHEEAMRQ